MVRRNSKRLDLGAGKTDGTKWKVAESDRAPWNRVSTSIFKKNADVVASCECVAHGDACEDAHEEGRARSIEICVVGGSCGSENKF
jgi:hypothetical protein